MPVWGLDVGWLVQESVPQQLHGLETFRSGHSLDLCNAHVGRLSPWAFVSSALWEIVAGFTKWTCGEADRVSWVARAKGEGERFEADDAAIGGFVFDAFAGVDERQPADAIDA